MTKVLINGLFLTQPKSVVQRYAFETLRALDELLSTRAAPAGLSFSVIAPANAKTLRLRNIGFEHVGWTRGHSWEQITLALQARGHFLMNLCPSAPLLCSNQSITLHDTALIAQPGPVGLLKQLWRRVLLPHLVRRVSYLMAVSNCAKWELVERCGADAERVHVSGEGWEHVRRVHSDPELLQRHQLLERPYLLVVGGLDPLRNLDLVTRTCRRLRLHGVRIVVAGSSDRRSIEQLDLGRYPNLRLLGEVTDQQLRALYEHALALVYTPRQNGAEFMPLEAMAFHCPVLSARTPLAQEICGEAALYFHPQDPEGLLRLAVRLLEQPAVTTDLAHRGFRWLRRRSWRAAAEEHLSALLHYCNRRSNPVQGSDTHRIFQEPSDVRHAV